MAFEIIKKLKSKSSDIYFDPKFRAIVEDHIHVLRTQGATTDIVPGNLFWKYEGNLFGYLAERGYNRNKWWIIMRINGFHHPYEFAKENRDPLNKPYDPTLIIPSDELISNLIKYRMTMKD